MRARLLAQIRAPRIPAPIFGKYGAASRSLLVHFRGLGSSRAVALPLAMLTGPGALEGAVF